MAYEVIEIYKEDQLDVLSGSTIEKIDASMLEMRDEYLQSHNHPWIIGFSGGKDSTLLLQLVFDMLLALPKSERRREIHVVSNDTMVESPLVIAHIAKLHALIKDAAEAFDLPLHVALTQPSVDQTFWVNLIGRGYPAPSRSFRWCTDRMKIMPTSKYIKDKVLTSGEVILLLGVRRSESSARAASANRYGSGRLNPHNDLSGCQVYRPILEFDTDEVWEVLAARRPGWGGSNRELIALYRNADGGECPVVTQKSDAPSCGTSSSRFGCWTCTVVEKDRSLEGFIDSGFAEFGPLLKFRDWLKKARDDMSLRQARRRDGKFTFMSDGRLVPGPFTFEARELILKRVLALQQEVGYELIRPAEVVRIKEIWASDVAKTAELHLRPTND
ncbi:DNA phosphorothioation system sulfurtransferase DndC [Burkholderia territorii]|uniref:DNA phosphorothioation system sulfurtransferase DndC n=1 Tax=Burkholderia territorii TaxID=1503055 RepID=UPI0009BC8B8F|nr:DNA phosphorothioation system sulfurtransferase DndC [Burkholderia territorii]